MVSTWRNSSTYRHTRYTRVMPAALADLSINARWIAPMTKRDWILEDHSLVVRNGRILAILPRAEAAATYAAGLVIDRPSHLLMPGLVNAHTQAATSLLRGVAARNPPLEQRLADPEFVRDGVLLSIAEMLASGTTCFADRSYFPDETARAVASQGMRAVIGLPVSEHRSPWAQTAGEYLTHALDVRDNYRNHPLISTAFAPHPPVAISDATFGRIATLADELDAGIAIQVHASAAEIGESISRHGRRPIVRLRDLGLLTPALNALHMAQVDGADIELAQRGGISASLCPESDLGQGFGLPPAAKLAAAGLRLGLGSGAMASYYHQDLWTEMKLLTAAAADETESGFSAWDALATATCGGAAALGLDADIGTLEPGKWADLCCADLSAPATQPLYHPITQLVFCGGRDVVTDVWVAGRQLLSDGAFTRLDWPGVAARANAWTSRLTTEG